MTASLQLSPQAALRAKDKPLNLLDLVQRFSSEEVCRDYLEKLRWPNGPVCPKCASPSVSVISTREQFDCNACRCRFSVTSGSVFDNTKLPLWKWFAAIYLMLESRKSMSANQIKRTIGVTYKSAWHLCHRIREAMETVETGPALFGVIELDETLLAPHRRHRGRGRKAMGIPKGVPRVWVAGALQRGGQVRLKRIANLKHDTIHAFVRSVAKPETEAFYTDELRSYFGLADADTRHASVRHSREEWVLGDVHTNGIESVWSMLKRSIVGAYHKISVKHLDAYLHEIEYRFNNRNNQFMFRDVVSRLLTKEALRYDALTAPEPR